MVIAIILSVIVTFLLLAMYEVTYKLNEQEMRIACLERKYLELTEGMFNVLINRTTNECNHQSVGGTFLYYGTEVRICTCCGIKQIATKPNPDTPYFIVWEEDK